MRIMEVVIKPVTYSAILQAPNAQSLLDAYSAECSIPEIGACSPQAETYAALEQSGAMQVFGMYKGETLIGFATVLCYTGTHYAEKVATVESIFLSPEHREYRAGLSLMLAVEQYADEQGCAAILYSAPTDSRFALLLSKMESYRNTNVVYCRRLN